MLRTAPSLVALLAIVLSMEVASPADATGTEVCPDYRIYGAAGTDGIGPNLDDDAPELLGNNTRQVAEEIKRLLGTGVVVDMRGVDYPAVAVPYASSVNRGIDNLRGLIDDFVGDCPNSELILVGYSQGGDLVGSFVQRDGHPDSHLDRVAGVVLMGDTRFESEDDWAAEGTFSQNRKGFWWTDIRDPFEPDVVDPSASPALDMKVVSVCRAWDAFCQGSEVHYDIFGNEFLWPAPDDILNNNPPNKPNQAHERYSENFDSAACSLVTKLGYDVCDPARAGAPDTDVVFLIDTTSTGYSSVQELQSRAEAFVDEVSHQAVGTRYAVIAYGEETVDNVTDGFVEDADEAIDAIESITASSGTYGSLYSAIIEANNLYWREDSKKVSLTLATSRTCEYRICSYEYGTGTPRTALLPAEDFDARRAGAYTRDNQWFFEAAGWSEAFYGQYESRLGEYEVSAQQHIDGLEGVFRSALKSPSNYEPIVGATSYVAGQTGTFRAEDIAPYYADSPDRRLVWSVTRNGDIGPRGEDTGGGPAAERQAAPEAAPSGLEGPPENEPKLVEELDEPLPPDEGSTFQSSFTEPGTYSVKVSAYLDGGVREFEQTVRVYDVPPAAPAAPLVESRIDGTDQVFHWFAGAGEYAPTYVFFDEDGIAVDSTTVETTLSEIGEGEFERRIPLGDPNDRYTLVAWNEVGQTEAIPLATATSGSYSHVTLDAGVPQGGDIVLSGDSSVEISELLSDGDLTANSNQAAVLQSPNGDQLAIDMTTASAEMTGGSDWQLTMALRDALAVDSSSIASAMDDGFAEELLLGGRVQLQLDGSPVAIQIAPSAEVEELDEFIIETNSTPPASSSATLIEIGQSPATLRVGSNDPSGLSFVTESADPLGDWSTAVVTDIRTWIGNTEVTNTLTGSSISVYGYLAPEQAQIDFTGDVVGGSGNLTRDFLQGGVVSFVVNGGSATALSLAMSSADAAAAYPDLDPPKIVGRSGISMAQYSEREPWSPVLSWGSGYSGQVTIDGTLPSGLSWDRWNYKLNGTPEQAGTYQFTLTAHGDYGDASKTYDLVVADPSAVAQDPVGQLWAYEYEDGNGDPVTDVEIASAGYYRTDNPQFASSLPVIEEFQQNGYIYSSVSDLVFHASNGDVMPIAGSAELQMWSGSPDTLRVMVVGAHRTDASTDPVQSLLTAGGYVTFSYGGGDENRVQFTAAS